MYKTIIFLIPFLIYFLGCAAVPVYRVNSLDKNTDLYMGLETVIKDDSTASISLQFQKQSGENYIFSISIKNNSQQQFAVDPKNIYTKIVQGNVSNKNNYFRALDPEKQLINIDKDINNTSAQQKTANGLFFLTSVVNLASDIATIGKQKSQEEVEETQYDREVQRQENIDENNYYDNKISSLKDKKEYWEHNIFRVSIFYPGDEIGGILVLPIVPDAQIIDIVVPVNNKEYNFIYKQTCID